MYHHTKGTYAQHNGRQDKVFPFNIRAFAKVIHFIKAAGHVEYIFGWNGLGKEVVEALNTLDLPVIMGSVLVIATTFVIINIIVDLIYAYLDPRIRLS